MWQTSGAETGKPEITSQLRSDGTPWYDPCGKAVLYRKGNTLVACFRVMEGVICPRAVWYGSSISIYVWIPRAFVTRKSGVLGDFDGDSSNDCIDRGGVRRSCRENGIYNHMLSCKSTDYNCC